MYSNHFIESLKRPFSLHKYDRRRGRVGQSHSPFLTFFIHKPIWSHHFHPFPYVCGGSWKTPTGPHPQTKNKTSTVMSAHSWASRTTWSTVWSLCFLCFTLSLTKEEDVEWTSESQIHACSARMFMVSSLSLSLSLCVCASVWEKWEELIGGSISPLASAWMAVLKCLYPILAVMDRNENHAYSHISP